jgi:dTDP-4-dehydrorhamnose 3,5-epimerase
VDQNPIVFMDQVDRARPSNGEIVRKGTIMPLCVDSFISGEIDQVVMRSLKVFKDARGWLVELFRQDELVEDNWPMMTYVSQTLPGVTRGPHEHVLQTDGFAFIGPSDFKLFLWDTRPASSTVGRRMVVLVGESNPIAVWIPPGVVHAYRNVGTLPGLVFNSPNRLYAGHGKKEPVDEIRHEENEPGRFRMD